MSPGFIEGIIGQSAPDSGYVRQVPWRQDHQLCGRSGAQRHKVHKSPTGTRYISLRNLVNLSERQRALLQHMPKRHLKTARAC